MKRFVFAVFSALLFSYSLQAQIVLTDSITVKTLGDVVVKGYEQNRPLREVAAAVAIIDTRQLQRSGTTSILPALNVVPGVHMEERSPGSYRLNIRGSSLRSPFGIRNVKIYLDDIPFTDPGGNSYLNQLSVNNFSSIEILKGPGASLYGAGTGGVMLIHSLPDTASNLATAQYARGSFGSQQASFSLLNQGDRFLNSVSCNYLSSDGYRDQSAMNRKVFSWETKSANTTKQELTTHLLYGDLSYETPGALTAPEYIKDPKASRPTTAFPSAKNAQAAIYQKTLWAGMHHRYSFNQHIENSTAVYGAFTLLRNPSVRNVEQRTEPHFGGRTSFSFHRTWKEATLKLVTGAEVQQGYFNVSVFKNNKGQSDSLQTNDDVNTLQYGVFTQLEGSFKGGWIITAGLSLNKNRVRFSRLSDVPHFHYEASFNNEVAPRLSILKTMNRFISVYALVSKGYSPPTVAELLPSTSIINKDLAAERGINYEAGARGNFFGTRLSADLNLFYFALQQAIVQRRDAAGADYFVNSGNTRQAGIETAIRYQSISNPYRFFSRSESWITYSYSHFQYGTFKQVATDFSGNALPGIPKHNIAGGIDIHTRTGLYTTLSYFYAGKTFLNDANTSYATAYHLLDAVAGFATGIKSRLLLDIFAMADNLLNERYSLGNDINAPGNRFYNAAPGINFRIGAKFTVRYRNH